MSNRYDPDYPSRDPGSREYGFRDSGPRESRDPGRSRDSVGRREDRYGQAQHGRDDDYSASDYRSSRYTSDDPYDYRSPSSRYTRQEEGERSSNPDAWYSGAPYYGAGYSGPNAGLAGPGSSSVRDSRRYFERSPRERYADERGVYQEPAWARDPRTGELHGYDYEARWPAGSREAYHRPVRWRSETELGQRDARENRWRSQDSPRSFGNYGKGPKGYVRSDERIREDVCDRLSDDDELDASDITVTVTAAEVRLEGTVLDRHSKHRAEDLAEAVSGVRDVTNNLRTRKGFFQEIGDKLSGDDKSEHRGHAGSGTHTTPNPSPPLQSSSKGGYSANR